MTSVRNHLPPLSGNRWLFFVGIAILAAGCSPKVRPVSTTVKTENPIAKKGSEKAAEKSVAARVSTISMLLPFNLDNLNAGMQYTPGTLSNANMSLDYYLGF